MGSFWYGLAMARLQHILICSLLLLCGLQGQCKRRVLFAAFVVRIAAFGV